MAEKKKANGRPKKELDYNTIEELANIMCTQEEIANILNVSVRTLQRDAEFCRIYKKGMDNGKSSLRRVQWQAAQNGNVTMQIWLGKQWLGQHEPTPVVEATVNGEVEALRDDIANIGMRE